MADLLKSQFSPTNGLRSAFRSDEDDAALAQMQADEALAQRDSAFGQGVLRGLHQTPAMLANALGQVVEPFSTQYSRPVFDWASEQNQTAQRIYSPAPQSYDQINGIGDAANYITGAIGENLPNMLATLPLGIAGRIGMRGAAMSPFAKNLAATSMAAFPLQMGEMAGSMREDPTIMENTTPLGRLGAAAGYGALTAPLEAADEALLMGRAMGAGSAVKNIFKDGIKATAKDAAKHVAKAIPEAALTEGLPEAAQTGIQQQMLSGLNPKRDTSGDGHDALDAFFKGWAAGGGTSVAGRGADVAWAQGRGATDAIRGLLQRKTLPDSLKDSDDRSILDWDDQDNAQRNSWAKDMADRIMNSDAAQSLKDSARSFYDKASTGARDAWQTMSDALGVEDKVGRARDGVEHFLGSIKKANQAAFGKANAESDPLDQAMYDNFSQYLDPKGASSRDTELKSRLFNGVKEALLDDDWHNLPWTRLEDEFGTIGRATDAVLKLRENLVRAGKLEHDDEFGKLFEATIKDGQQGERAMMDVVARYGREYIKRKPNDAELRDVVRGLRTAMQNPEWMRKNKAAFDAEMKKQFGSNAEKVIAALAPKNNVEAGIETEAETVDDTTGQTFKAKSAEEFTPGTRFIGSGIKGLRKQVASDEPGQNVVANHGGFWSLGHSDAKTRSEIQARFKDTAADLRKSGHYVRELSPLDYAVEAGVSIRKVARHVLGTKAIAGMTDEQVRDALKDHPARMLAVDERDMEKDKLSLDNDDLLNLSDKLKESFSAFDKGMPVPDKELRGKIAAALAKKGSEQRSAMKALGLEHGTKLRLGKNGAYLENNPRHSGNGVFMVKMKDGTSHHISAQQLISLMRERGKGQFSSRSAYDMFNSGIAALMSIDGVEAITAQDVWGREDTQPFELKKNKKGKWNNYFQLEPGLTLNDARKASRRGQSRDKVMEELEAAYEEAVASGDEDSIEQAQQDIDDELAERAAFQDQLEGEGQREAVPGAKGATTKNVTPTEHAREPVQDFNDDGTPKHPYGKPVAHEQTQHLEFNGVPMRVRAGVSGKHFTEGARKVIAVAKALQKIKNSPTFTNSRMDMALDLAARSAAAQKDGNVEARNAAVFAAADAIRQAALDEIEIAQGLGETKAVDKLTDLAARVIDLAAQYEPAKHDALLAEYAPKTYKPKSAAQKKVFEAAPERWSHHRGFLEKLDGMSLEELEADGKARAARLEQLRQIKRPSPNLEQLIGMMEEELSMGRDAYRQRKEAGPVEEKKEVIKAKEPTKHIQVKTTDPFQKARDDLQGKVDTQKAMADEGRARAKAEKAWMELSEEERTAHVETASKPVEEALSNLGKLSRSYAGLVKTVKQALRTLKEAWVNGELDKAELIKNLRDAVAALKAVAGDAVNVVRDAAQKFVAKYRRAMADIRATPISKNGKGYFSVNKIALSEADMGEVNQKMLRFLKKLQTAENQPIELKRFNNFLTNVEGSEQYGFLPVSVQNQAEVRIFMDGVKQYLIEEGFPVQDSMFVVHGETGYAYMGYHPFTNTFTLSTDALRTVGNLITGENVSDQERMDFVQSLLHEAAHKMDFIAVVSGNPINLSALNEELRHGGFLAKEAMTLMNSSDKFKNLAWPLGYANTIAKQGNLFASELFAQLYSAYKLHNTDVKAVAPNIHAFMKEVENAKSDEERRASIAGYLPENFDGEMEKVFQSNGKTYSPSKYLSGRTDGSGTKGGDVDNPGTKHNAEGSFANGKAVTQAELDAAKDYVAKVLGPKVKVELVKALGGNSAAWNRVNGEAIIRIAANASNPLSKAHHEAMHEFFQRLMDAHPEAAEVLRTAANSPLVKRQIEQFFHNDANYAKIKAAIANDEHERVAYMFQLWAAGKLNVGPKTQNWFQKIKGFLQKAFGMMSNDQQAEAIMQSFHDGKMSEPNAVAQVLAGNPNMAKGLLERAGEWAEPIANTAKEILYTAQNILSESGNKGFQNIGKLFSTETGATSQEMSFMDAKVMKTNQMNDRLWAIIKDADEKDIAAALEGLQRGETSKDADIAKIQQRMRKFLDQMHDYATAAGMDMKKVQNYFPRVWDAIAIAENKDKFVEMLKADHFKETGKPLDDVTAKGIAENLIRNRGHEPVNETELANGYSPFMASANKRVLDFIKSPEFSEFQEKSIEGIMTTYISQLVHKAEYTRRFGSNGDKLRDMVIDAVGEEVGPEWATAKKAAQTKLDALKASYKGKPRAELTKKLAELGYRYGGLEVKHVADELSSAEAKAKFADFEPALRRNVRAIMAMEGTLGAEINPALRKWSAGLMVYENLRLLGMSLFSQVIDPLGVMVRGGTVGDAWNTFKRGITGTIAGWRGKPVEDSATRLAMQLGIIDVGGWMNSQGNAYTSLYMGKTAQKWNDRLFRWNGVEGFSQGTRVGATQAAVAFLKYHSTLPSEHSARWLEELNVTPADLALTNGELDYTNPKVQQAIFRWVEGAILRPNASMRPSWASDPHMALLFHLKQFTYAMQKVLLERVFNEAKHGNMDPGITMVLTYVPTMIAADFLRGIVANGGQEPPWKRNWDFGDYLVEGVQRAGLLGVPQFALDTAKWGPAELAGPVAEQIAKAGKTYYKDLEKDAHLDRVAGYTQAVRDIERAEKFDGLDHATKKTLRDALPINGLTKRYLYDELVN